MRFSLLVLLLAASALAGRRGGSTHGTSHGTSHTYPHNTGYSGNSYAPSHSYPQSNGLSGTSNQHKQNYNHHQSPPQHTYSSRSEVHHHYHYSPPQQIVYGSTYHPVYHGTPPVYVYEYRDSGSRFDNLLTGLALYNLGRMSANSHHYNYDSNRDYSYTRTPGEVCKLGISKRTGEYEETRIDCTLMSSFIFDSKLKQSSVQHVSSETVSTTVTNITQTVSGNTSVTTVTVKNESVTDALKTKGPSIQVTPGMTCYMIRIYRDISNVRENVDCELLQKYALSSMRRNNSERLKPILNYVIHILITGYVISVF